MTEVVRIRGLFDDYGAFVCALRALKESGMRRYEAYGPTDLNDVEDLMPEKGSLVRVCATSGAVTGLATFWLMCVFTSLIYSLVVGGKPPVSNIPYVIPAYEGTILFGSVAAFLAVLLYARFGNHDLPPDYDSRMSSDMYGVDVFCRTGERERIAGLLRDAGAIEVTEL